MLMHYNNMYTKNREFNSYNLLFFSINEKNYLLLIFFWATIEYVLTISILTFYLTTMFNNNPTPFSMFVPLLMYDTNQQPEFFIQFMLVHISLCKQIGDHMHNFR